MAALLDPRRVVVGQSPELPPDARTAESSPGKAWNPLIVPREVCLREGLAWNSHQPVSLTVEVNGIRDTMKYAAVMQFVEKVGFVARLGQPGAAAKFQNLHLVEVKRRGSTDIHISLGDLAWAQSRLSEIPTTITAPVTAPLPPLASVSPDCSDIASGACVLSGGAAEGGVVSGSSSEGTSTHPSSASVAPVTTSAVAAHLDAGTSTDTQSHGDVGSDHDEKNTVNSAAPASTVERVDVDRPPTAAPADAAVTLRCGCTFCPCNLDPQDLAVSTGDMRLLDKCAGQQMACARSTPGTDAAVGPAGGVQNHLSSPPTDPRLNIANPSSSDPPTHISRDRLRNLYLPSKMKSSAPAVASKAAAGSRLGSGYDSPRKDADASDAGVETAGDMQSTVTVIGSKLPLPSGISAKLSTATHVLVQYEIDGELAECKMQYRLALSADGCTTVLAGVSAPLRGLQLVDLGEVPGGDLFIRAATLPTRPNMRLAPAQQVGRSSRGRQRRPSLKARECPEGGGVAAAIALPSGPNSRGKAGPLSGVSALPPLYPQPSALADMQPNLAQKASTQTKRRGRAQIAWQAPTGPAQQIDDEQYAAAQDGLGNGTHNDGDEHERKFGSAAKRPKLASKAVSTPMGSDDDGAALLALAARGHVGASIRRRRSMPEAGPASASGLALADRRASASDAMPAPVLPSGRSRQPRSRKGSTPAAAASADESSAADQDDLQADGCPVGAEVHTSLVGPSGRVGRKRESTVPRATQHAELAPSPAIKRPREGDPESEAKRSGARALEVLRRSALEELQAGLASGRPHASPQGSEVADGDLPSTSAQEIDDVADAAGNPAAANGRNLRARRPVRYMTDPGSCSECSAPDDSDGGRADGRRSASSGGGAGAGAELALTMHVEDNNPLALLAITGTGGMVTPARSMPLTVALPRSKPRARSTVSKSKSKPIRHPSKITNVVRNAGAIILMIGRSPMMYEKQLRATFGNNPDTSKALRLLEEQGKVVRGGLGYRMHPYHYTLTPGGLQEYERLLAEQGPSHAFALTMGVQLPSSDGASVVVPMDQSNALQAGAPPAVMGAAAGGGATVRGVQSRRAGEQAQATSGAVPRATMPQAAGIGNQQSDGAIFMAQPSVGCQSSLQQPQAAAAQQTPQLALVPYSAAGSGEAAAPAAPAVVPASAPWYGWPPGVMGSQPFCFPGYNLPPGAGNSTSAGGHQPSAATTSTPATSSTSAGHGAVVPPRGGAQTAFARESSAGPPAVFVHPPHPFMGHYMPGPSTAGHVGPALHLPAYQHAAADVANPPGEPEKQCQNAATCQPQATKHHQQHPFTMYGYVPTPYGYMPCAMFNPFPPTAPTTGSTAAGSGVMPPHLVPFATLPPPPTAAPHLPHMVGAAGAPMPSGSAAPEVTMGGPVAFTAMPHYPATMSFPPGAAPPGPINATAVMRVQQGLQASSAPYFPSYVTQSHAVLGQSSTDLQSASVPAEEAVGPEAEVTNQLSREQPMSQPQQAASASNDAPLVMDPVSASLADSTDAGGDPAMQV